MPPDAYFFSVDAARHLMPVSTTASSGTAVLGPAEPGTSTARLESGFHTTYKVVASPEPAGPLYGTVGHEDYVTVTLEGAVVGLCLFAALRRRD